MGIAISMVMGQLRSDGLSFWTFIQHRVARLCRSTKELWLVRPDAIPQPGQGQVPVWIVVFDGPNCNGFPNQAWVAAVWTDTGVITPMRTDRSYYANDGSGNMLRHQPPVPNAWLDDFHAGKKP